MRLRPPYGRKYVILCPPHRSGAFWLPLFCLLAALGHGIPLASVAGSLS